MKSPQRTTLGLDVSTQSISAVLLNVDSGESVWSRSIAYREDARLLGYGFEHDTMIMPAREPGEAEQPPRLFVAALEALLDDLSAAGHDTRSITAINTSGQQHGHVYLNDKAESVFRSLHDNEFPPVSLALRFRGVFAYGGAPIWKTANTADEAEHIRACAGGKAAVIARTGSDLPLRFSVMAHRKIAQRYPQAYASTCRILQISSLIPALLAGDCTIPLDFGNACGTGLMNYQDRRWDPTLLDAAAGDLPGGSEALAGKLSPIAHPLTTVGRIAPWFQRKYGFDSDCRIIAGSGDNPQSMVLAEGNLLSLGTSFVYMIMTPLGDVDASGAANAMYDALGRPFNLVCRSNGALTWERLRILHGLDAHDFSKSEDALATIPPGERMRFWQPDPESFPITGANPELVRLDGKPPAFADDYAGVVDSSLGLVYRYGEKIATSEAGITPLSVCGGPSGSTEILHRVAAIWNRPVLRIGQAGAALGAAVAAAASNAWESDAHLAAAADSLRSAIHANATLVQPDPDRVRRYHGPGGFLDSMESAFETLRA